jgi:endonuclease-3
LSNIVGIFSTIERKAREFTEPSVTLISSKKDPFLILVSCLLSLRTKDRTTIEASNRLFKVADNPKDMVKLSAAQLSRLIYPVGFYRNKARVVLGVSRRILDDFSGRVPDELEKLLSLKGVGRKTANLVLGLGFNIPAICVDTHVHRIANRLGWVRTKTPQETEEALMKVFPRNRWIGLNSALVAFGQNLCLPVSPLCSKCPVFKLCKRTGIKKSR